MTQDDLLSLITESFSQRPERGPGGFLFCPTPHAGEFSCLARVYDPVSTAFARTWGAETCRPDNPYFRVVTEVANGLQIATLSLGGVIDRIDRSIGPGVGQPIDLRYGNVVGRPTDLDDADMVIGSIVGWSSKGAYVMDSDGAVRLVHASNGADIADEWPSLTAMLRAELARLAQLHDPEGRELCTSTDLMHPHGRRWETEIEPGSIRH